MKWVTVMLMMFISNVYCQEIHSNYGSNYYKSETIASLDKESLSQIDYKKDSVYYQTILQILNNKITNTCITPPDYSSRKDLSTKLSVAKKIYLSDIYC